MSIRDNAADRAMQTEQPLSVDTKRLLTLLRRRWWWVLGPPVFALLGALFLGETPPKTYQSQLKFAVDIPAEALSPGSDEGTAAGVGEALVDDMARIIPGDVFADAVSARLDPSTDLSAGEISSALSADDKHRIVELSVSRTLPGDAADAEVERTKDELLAISLAVVDELSQNGGKWFSRLGTDQVSLTLVDRPERPLHPLPPGLRQKLDLPLRVSLALLFGIGIALLLHGMDQRLYSADELRDELSLDVLAEIPS